MKNLFSDYCTTYKKKKKLQTVFIGIIYFYVLINVFFLLFSKRKSMTNMSHPCPSLIISGIRWTLAVLFFIETAMPFRQSHIVLL